MNDIKIGFVLPNKDGYYKTMASTRLRGYDIINYLNSVSYNSEIFNYKKKYNYVLFQKSFNLDARILAKKLKIQKTKIIFDINVNYIENNNIENVFLSKAHTDDVKRMLDLSDCVITSSEMLKEIYSKYHSNVVCIEENVSPEFFKENKKHSYINEVKLLYCGYSIKAKEILIIKDVLNELIRKFEIKILFVTEKDPLIKEFPSKYIKYNQKKITKILLDGDIKIAPRLINEYNIGHSFTKVAYPMSLGIPAVASAIPSYLNREVLICTSDDEWYNTLKSLIESHEMRNYYGQKAREFVKNNFSIDVIGKKYLHLFDS
jgi:glycosyltransferase involved in cell wall biosynthesis